MGKNSKNWNYRWNHVAADIVGLFRIRGAFHFACIYVFWPTQTRNIHTFIYYICWTKQKICKRIFFCSLARERGGRKAEGINIKMEYVCCMLNGLKQPFVQKSHCIWFGIHASEYGKRCKTTAATTTKTTRICWTRIFFDYSLFSDQLEWT